MLKTARLTLLIDPNKKAAFERLCALQDRTTSQVVRQLIRDYLAQYEVRSSALGSAAAESDPAEETPRPLPERAPQKTRRPLQYGDRSGARRKS